MNNYIITFFIMYAISTLMGLYNLSLGDKMIKPRTHREAGMTTLVSMCIGIPLFLAAVGIIG